MKTSQVTTALPKTPVGFEEPQTFLYPKVALNIAAFGSAIGAAFLFGVVTWWLHGAPQTGSFAVSLPIICAVFLSAVGMIVVHEALHGMAYRILGYRVSFGVILRMGAAYTAAFGQMQRRAHTLIAAATPLVVLTAICAPLLASSQPLVAASAYTILVLNTAGAVGDSYLIWRLLHLPQDTLTYDVSGAQMLFYVPQRGT